MGNGHATTIPSVSAADESSGEHESRHRFPVPIDGREYIVVPALTTVLEGKRAIVTEFVPEFYADLEYADNGSVAVPPAHGSNDPADVRARVRRVIEDGTAVARSGLEIPMRVRTIGVHPDTPGAVEVVKAIRAELFCSDSAGA